MCVSAKIEEIQFALLSHEFPKSGYNKFSKNRYHELKDILPPIMKECHKRDLVLLFNFDSALATLDVADKNNVKNFYRFTMPMPKGGALNKQMNEIQSIGADSTYLKRYLLMNAFLILEDDVADALEPANESQEDVEKPSKDKVAKNNGTPEVITKALIDLDNKGVPITKASVYSKCNQLGMSDDIRKTVIDWIGENVKGDSK